MRIGLVGYGKGGRTFHAPYIEAAEGVVLAGVVTRNPTRRAELAEDFPGVPAHDSLTELLDAGVDAVAITTPPHTRRELVLEAIDRGVPVVADKPFAPNAVAGQELVDAAAAAGVPLAVFHNRRWDTDIRTLRAVLNSDELGRPTRIGSRFDRNSHSIDPGPAGGVLRDLGTHLADQMIWLFGPVRQVYAALDWIDLPEGRTDAGFTVTMRHAAGPVSTITASKGRFAVGREFWVYAERGSYHSAMADVQIDAVLDGRRPITEGASWGYEVEERWGSLRPPPAYAESRPREAPIRTITLSSPEPSPARPTCRSPVPKPSAPFKCWTRHAAVMRPVRRSRSSHIEVYADPAYDFREQVRVTRPQAEDLADDVTAYAFMATRQENDVSRERADHPNRLLPLLVERVQEGDVEGLVDLFEDQAVLDTGNGVASGSAALREFWEGFVASGTTVTVGQQAQALINGELALTSTRMPDGVVTVEIARRQADGAWKWVIDQPNLPVTPD